MAFIYRIGTLMPKIHPTAYIAPSATIIGNVVIEAHASIWFNVVIRGDNDLIVIGEGSNIQDGAILHADQGAPLKIGKNVTVGHMAMLHGCSIEDNVIVGVRATVLNHSVIPEYSFVAAGALVGERKTYEPGSQLLGAPVKMVKKLEEHVAKRIPRAAEHYMGNNKRYTQTLRQIPLDSAFTEELVYQEAPPKEKS